MTQLRWWTGGMIAVALLALAVFLLSGDETASLPRSSALVSPDVSSEQSSTTGDSAQDGAVESMDSVADSAALAAPDTSSDAEDAATSSVTSDVAESGDADAGNADTGTASDGSSGSGVVSTTVQTTSGGSNGAASSTNAGSGVRLRIPSLGVDAVVVNLGYDDQGQLDVPSDAYSVGWYTISTRPGENGNALLGGHLNWQGSRGVFDRLDELSDGDLIYLVQDGEELVYEVSRSWSVTADAPLSEVLRVPAAGSTLTLFTCGGTYDQRAGEYDHRLVVNAVRVAKGAG